jgi:copper chaperone CopZ
MKAVLQSNAIHCDGCAANVRRALAQHPGVRSVDIDAQTKQVNIDFDKEAISVTALKERLADAGYPVDKLVQLSD